MENRSRYQVIARSMKVFRLTQVSQVSSMATTAIIAHQGACDAVPWPGCVICKFGGGDLSVMW